MADGYISQIKLPNEETYDFRDRNLKVYTGSCSTAAGTAIKDVVTDGIFTLEKGAVLFVNFTNTNSAAVGNLKLKINGEADTNAKPIKYLVNGNDPANIPGAGYLRANQTYMFRYDGTNWVADLNYYTYSNDFANKIGHYNNILARKAIAAESLIVGDETGYEKVASGVTFNLAYPIVWCTGAVNANASNYANMFLQHYDRNIATGAKSGFTSTANKAIYLIVTINGNIATIDSNIITDTLPSSDDGKVYISLGKLGAQSTGANYFFLYPVHPMFWYKNGAIREYSGASQYALAAPLSGISGADDLKAIEAISGTTGLLKKTAANTWTLDTNTYLTAHRTYTAVSGKKPIDNQTPGFGSTFDIEQVDQDTTGQVSVTERTVKIPDTAASTSVAGLITTGAQTLGGGKTLKFTNRIYPLIGTSAERSKWYKIIFPYSTITTGSSAQWFMNSFDLHFGGGYSSNPSGVAHVTFYWTRAANNGAWTVGQQAAFIEGTLANKIGLYYRIAEPGILYVNNTSGSYNGIWIDNLYVDDTSTSLDWSTITITNVADITESTSPKLSDYTKITTSYLYNDSGTLKTDGNFEGKYIKGTWLYTSAATAKTSTAKLATIESDNFIYYITPANALKSAVGTTAIGAAKTPIYWDGSKFAAGDVLKNLAYKDSLIASDIPDLSETYVKKVTSTDNAIARFDGTGGQIQNSGVIIDDNNNISVSSILSNLYSGYNLCKLQTSASGTEIVIKTKFKFVSSSTMPSIRIHGYSYGKGAPLDLTIVYYIYGNEFYVPKVISTGGISPDIYLFTYTENNIKYVAVGIKSSLGYLGFTVDANGGALGGLNINSDSILCTTGWTIEHNGSNTSNTLIPAVNTDNCKLVPYIALSTTVEKTISANLTSTTNAVAYYTNTTGTFGSKASANGALYATSANGALQWGTLPIAQGGTGKTTANDAANALISGLPTWTANPTDDTYLIRRDTGGTATYGQVKFSTVWNYIKSKADNVYANQTTVNGLLAAADAMIFKGTLDGAATSSNGGAGGLTPAANCGDTYKVATIGYINGEPVEVGDIIICTTDSTIASTSSNYSTVKANWVIVQNNVDGAIFKGTNGFTDTHVIIADGTNGKVKDSGFTIASSVPANAKFTDTTSFTITANATDGYWDLTGTNGTNAVTYALTPYSSKQSGANFYTGTANPDGTTRLNYNGYLYATKLYSNGTEVSVSGHTHDYAGSSSAGGAATSANALNFVHTNELLLGNANSQSGIHINHRRVSGGATSGNTAITDYYFKNGNGAVTGVTIHAAAFDGSATSAGKWTTARNISISDSDGTNTGAAVSVDGSAAVTLKLPATIKADITGDAATVNGLTVQTAVPANAVFTDTNKYHKTGSWSGLTYTATAVNNADELKFTIPNKIQTNWELNATSGNSPALLFTRDSTLTDWKIFVTSGKLSFQSATDSSTWTERAYFKDNSGDFVATSFTGDGSDLTNLNASNISSGTLNSARIPDLSWNKITSDKPAYTTRWPTWDEVTSKPVLPTGNARIFYGTCSDAAAAKTVTCAAYDSLQDGDILFVNFSAVNTGAVGSITLNVNGTGARNVKYLNNGSDPANIPGAGYIRAATYMFRYKQGTTSTNSYWIIDIQYDSNSNTYDRTYVNNNKKARVAITAGSICVGDSTGYAGIDNGVTFDITYPILYSPNSISAGSYRADLYIYIPSITSTENTTGLTHVANGILYMTGTLSGNTFTCNSKTLTYTQPTSEDGIIYIPVAINTNATTQSLYFFGGTAKMFWYKNGAFRPYVNDAATVNGHTVATDVPSNAVFTDTTYTFDGTYNASSNKAATVSTVTNAVNALDGTITGTPSNTNTITAFSQTNGKVSATFAAIDFPVISVAGLTDTISASALTTALGLSSAMHYRGTSATIPPTSGTYASGDVLVKTSTDEEYVYDGTNWRLLGSEGSYKVKQSNVADPTASTSTSTTFIDTISQNINGVISATKKTLPTASTEVAGIIKIGTGSTNAMAGNTTVTNVSYTATTDNYEYPILMKNSTGSTTTAAGARFASGANQQVTINPSTGTISTRRLVINNSSSNGTVPDLVFSRTSWSYINIPDNDAAVLAIGRGTGDNASQKLIIQGDGTVRPGSDNTQFLGTSARRWQKVYGVNFYGTFNGTATSAQQLAAREIDNSDLNQFSSGGALKYAWVGGGNSILSKPTNVNAFGIIAMKTATNWTGQLLMSTDSEPGLYWRTNLTTETPSYGSWTPLASGNGGVYYGTCETAADVVEKVVVCKHYHTLKAGDIIVVTFTNSNTQAQPKLNVNNTGAVGVKMAYSGGIVDLGSTTQLSYTCTFIYNGTYWLIINQQNTIQIATASNQTNWRSILLSNSNDGDENFTPSANTLGRTYAAHNVKYQPSTGTLRAPIMKTPKVQIEYDHVNKAHIQWNDTDSSIDFIFD